MEVNGKIKSKEDSPYILTKKVDWPIFNYGLGIAKELQGNIWSAIGFKMRQGKSQIINLQINSKLCNATLINLASKEKSLNQSDVVQIVYAPTSDFALEMRKTFKSTYEYLVGQRQNKYGSSIVDLPPNLKHGITITYLKDNTFLVNETNYFDKIIEVIEKNLSGKKIDFSEQSDACLFTQPYKIIIFGKEVDAQSWEDVLVKVCKLLIISYPDTFYKLVKNPLFQKNQNYFLTYNENLLTEGAKNLAIRQLFNGMWIEFRFAPHNILKICKSICNECGVDISNAELLFPLNHKLPKSHENVLTHRATMSKDIDEGKYFSVKYQELYKTIEQLFKNSQCPLSFDEIAAINQNYKATIRHILNNSDWVVYSGGKYIYRDNISEFNKVAEVLLETLKSLFIHYNGYASAKQLYDSVKAKLDDFFFYNGFESQNEVFDLAKHFFKKEHYKGYNFIFYNGIHIWEKEPNYPKSYTGLFVKWARENNGIISREECMKGLESIGAGNTAANYSNSYYAGKHLFWQYDSYKFFLVEAINIDKNWKEMLLAKLTHLLQDVQFIALRDIDEYWYNSLPSLSAEISWSPLLLQEVLRDIDIGFKTISAGDGQDINAVHAVVLSKTLNYNTFGDIVWKIVDEEYGTPTDKIDTEDLRKLLVRKNILQGNERIYVMHKAIKNDLRFLWMDNNKKVVISKG